MKTKITITMMALLVSLTGMVAQSVLVVNPGSGTLNTAISTYGGTRIYQLKAGEWYALNAPIENVDYHLQIIGAEPAVIGGMPATLQTGTDVNGGVFGRMFNAKGNITLRNIFVVNADLTGQVGQDFMTQSKTDARITIDRCVFHPACIGSFIDGQSGNTKTYFTNNQVIGHGHQLNPNDGNFFNYDNTTGVGLDSLYVENNTFVCIGMNLFRGSFVTNVNNLVKFNHNTIVFAKSQIDWSTKKMEEYWTNNLLFDVQTQPYSTSWQPMPGGDAARPKPNLIYADTLPNEILPSTRTCFVQYNSHYRAKGFYDNLVEFNAFAKANNVAEVYLYPLTWPKEQTDCREAYMFNSTGFPQFKYGNTITDVDPQWADARIYTHEASFIQWTKPATYVHALGQPSGNYPTPSLWPQYWWIPSGDLSNNSVWPVFNGKYTNAQTLTGSIENLPLGDLNWFPASKAIWQSNKANIEAHIKAGNTDKINLTGITEIKDQSTMIYPNPAKNEIFIKGAQNVELTIMSLDGRILKTIKNVTKVNVSDLANGSYLISIKEGNRISTQKLLIER